MKKISFLLAAILLSAVFTIPAGASPYYMNVQTEGINSSPQMQAEMLGKLSLFRGTDKGFELERPMTRAEAAVMFVRFLGAEKTALSGTWKHPFSDVPSWAEPYIGWLWQNGLTKGVSATQYGAQQAVTIRQYAGLLARALLGPDAKDDFWTYCATEDEAKLCDENGFFNRDAAVGLSVRALTLTYKAPDGSSMSLAQFLISQGTFTAGQLGDASWFNSIMGVPPSEYRANGENGALTRYVAGVPVARCEEAGLTLAGGTQYSNLNYLHATRIMPDGMIEFFILDAKTLKVMASDSYQSDGNIQRLAYIGTVYGEHGGMDYLTEERKETGGSLDVGEIFSWDGKELKRAVVRENLWQDGEFVRIDDVYAKDDNGACRIEDGRGWRRSFTSGNSLLLAGTDTLLYFTQDVVHKCPYPVDTQLLALNYDSIVAQRVNDEKTVISCIDARTGATLDEYTVLPDMEGDAGRRSISRQDYSYFYGEAGLYDFFDGRLYQLTDRPALSTAAINEGRVILTHSLGERVQTALGPGGNSLMLLNGDGSTKTLLGNDPPHGIGIVRIDSVNSELRFYNYLTDGNRKWYYTYALTGTGIRVVDYTPGRPEAEPGWSEDNPDAYKAAPIAKEQARLDALGYGYKG